MSETGKANRVLDGSVFAADVHQEVKHLKSSHEMWCALEHRFAERCLAEEMDPHLRLNLLKLKPGQEVDEYLRESKIIVDPLAVLYVSNLERSGSLKPWGYLLNIKSKGYTVLCVGFPSSDLVVETQDEDEVYWLQFGRYLAHRLEIRD